MNTLGRRRRITHVLPCAVVIGILLASSPSAWANGGATPDALQGAALPPVGAPAVDPDTYSALFGGLPADPPSGAVVADSGFRPFPNGFSFLNYGSDLSLNQRLFGQTTSLTSAATPARAVGLSAASLRRVFGDGVCLPNAGRSCLLTESSKVVQRTATSWAAAGHCFGIATLANALFTGKLNRAEVHGGYVNTLTTLSESTQQAVIRAFVSQYFSARGIRPPSTADAIARLRASLAPGKMPYMLLIYGAPGGHALVPYAVLDRGNGLFDIAVYDANLPN